MPFVYKTDLIAPEKLDSYKAANTPGSQIVLPDPKNPEKTFTYLIEDIEIKDADPHPVTKEPFKLVTLRLKQA